MAIRFQMPIYFRKQIAIIIIISPLIIFNDYKNYEELWQFVSKEKKQDL